MHISAHVDAIVCVRAHAQLGQNRHFSWFCKSHQDARCSFGSPKLHRPRRAPLVSPRLEGAAIDWGREAQKDDRHLEQTGSPATALRIRANPSRLNTKCIHTVSATSRQNAHVHPVSEVCKFTPRTQVCVRIVCVNVSGARDSKRAHVCHNILRARI